MKKTAYILTLFILTLPGTLSAQSDDEKQNLRTTAESYMEAVRVFDFLKAAQYGDEHTRIEMARNDSSFRALSPQEQRKEKARLQNGKYIVKDMEIVGDSATVSFDWEPGRKGTQMFILYSGVYFVKTDDGRWLAETLSFEATIDRESRREYRKCKEQFFPMGYYSTFPLSFDIVRSEPLPFWNDEYPAGKIYPLEILEDYRQAGIDLLTVRYENPQQVDDLEETLTYADYLLIVKDEKIDLRNKLLLARYDSLHYEDGFYRPYYWDDAQQLHISRMSAPQFDADVQCPYRREEHTVYEITNEGQLYISHKHTFTRMQPATYEAFKRLFPDVRPGNREPLAKDGFTLGPTPYIPIIPPLSGVEATALGKIENYRGYDLFLTSHTDRFSSPVSDNVVSSADYVTVIRPSAPEEEVSFSQIGYEYTGEGGSNTFSYYVDADSTLVVRRINKQCCSASGYSVSIDTDKTSRYTLSDDGKAEETEVMQHIINSDFFDLKELEKLKDVEEKWRPYPRKEDPELLFRSAEATPESVGLYFYVDKSEKGNLCLCFFSTYNVSQPVDYITICPKKNKLPPLAGRKGKPAPTGSKLFTAPVRIPTSEGAIELRPDGTLKLIKKAKR